MTINSEIRTSTETFAAEIVAAYVSNNPVPAAELPGLIDTVRAALEALGAPAEKAPEPEPLVPAVSIKRSVTPDHIVCLECGKSFKSLKRHLLTHHGLAPEDYRQRWSLQASYPMVAPNYADARSQLALSMGLGRKRGAEEPVAGGEEEVPPAEARAEESPAQAAPEAAAPEAEAKAPAAPAKGRGRAARPAEPDAATEAAPEAEAKPAAKRRGGRRKAAADEGEGEGGEGA